MANRKNHWVPSLVSYWSQRICESDIGVDWDDADERCWRCGCDRTLQKCHIVAKQFGGSDDEQNIVPLCSFCHDEMPDVRDPSEVWRWIRETKPLFYGTLVAERAMAICLQRGVNFENFDSVKLKALQEDMGIHFMQNGTGARTKVATIAWALERACGGSDR